jgi:hypothetical protein
LDSIELNSPLITEKMSSEAQEKFKSLITETRKVFEVEKVNIEQDLVDSLDLVLNKISQKL